METVINVDIQNPLALTLEQLQRARFNGKFQLSIERLNPLHSKHLEESKSFVSKKEAIHWAQGGYEQVPKYILIIKAKEVIY